jgi:hypothetical protein
LNGPFKPARAHLNSQELQKKEKDGPEQCRSTDALTQWLAGRPSDQEGAGSNPASGKGSHKTQGGDPKVSKPRGPRPWEEVLTPPRGPTFPTKPFHPIVIHPVVIHPVVHPSVLSVLLETKRKNCAQTCLSERCDHKQNGQTLIEHLASIAPPTTRLVSIRSAAFEAASKRARPLRVGRLYGGVRAEG